MRKFDSWYECNKNYCECNSFYCILYKYGILYILGWCDFIRKISYKKLWVKIAENEMSRAEFRKKVEIAPNTLTKLNQNENVSLEIIIKICEFLNCNIGDVCEIAESKEG